MQILASTPTLCRCGVTVASKKLPVAPKLSINFLMLTKVIHIKDSPPNFKNDPNFVYIGRGSLWGNMWVMNSEDERQDVVEAYRKSFHLMINSSNLFKERTASIKGKILVCYCKPKACHGDVIAEYLNALQEPALPK